MKNDSLVSILIPVYNREKYIEQCVRSAMSQTYENIEIIIVDNGSSDKTVEIIQGLQEEDSRIKLFQNRQNIGPVKNWKRCIDEASGEYGKILWSDDYITDTFLDKTVPYFADQHVGFVYTRVEVFGEEFKTVELYNIGETKTYRTKEYIEQMITGDGNYPVSPGCALFRMQDLRNNLMTDIPNKVNADLSQLAIGNDLLLFLLTASQYDKFEYVNETLSYFRAHEESITISSKDGQIPIFYALAKAFFVERYQQNLVKKFNIQLRALLRAEHLETKKYGFMQIEDFYMKNRATSLPMTFYVKAALRKLKRMMGI